MSTHVSPVENRPALAIGLVLISLLMFTVVDTAAKWLVLGGMPPLQAVFLRYAIHLVLVVAIFLPRRGKALLTTRDGGGELMRGLLLLGSTVANFIAVQYLPLTITVAMNFLGPLLICLMSIGMLGERVAWQQWLAVAIGLAGIVVIVQPGSASFHWAVGISFIAVACMSAYMILNRRLAGIDSAATQQFYVALVATVVVAPFGLQDWHWPTPGIDWVAMGLMGTAGYIGHQLSSVSHRLAGASTLAPFTYFQVVYMAASSWLIFNQEPDWSFYVGIVIIMAGGLIVWNYERGKPRPA